MIARCPVCACDVWPDEKHDDPEWDFVCPTCCHICEDSFEGDLHPQEPCAEPSMWVCALHGCMWWMWSAVDRLRGLAGWRHVNIRPYQAPPKPREGQLFA